MATSKTAAETLRYQVNEASRYKHRLLDIVRALESERGCAKAAQQLESIVARLEAWQARHGKE